VGKVWSSLKGLSGPPYVSSLEKESEFCPLNHETTQGMQEKYVADIMRSVWPNDSCNFEMLTMDELDLHKLYYHDLKIFSSVKYILKNYLDNFVLRQSLISYDVFLWHECYYAKYS